jgi:hypothetical protein
MLDQADGDATRVGAELQRLEIVPASSTKNSLYKSVSPGQTAGRSTPSVKVVGQTSDGSSS